MSEPTPSAESIEPSSANFAHELQLLLARINYEVRSSTAYSQDFKLGPMKLLLERLGNPQNRGQIVHVAGTKGKGSVSRMIASILQESGLKVGVYSSPHIESLNERFTINGQAISDHNLAILLQRLRTVASQANPVGEIPSDKKAISATVASSCEPLHFYSFFEMVTAAALLYFAESEVDWVVLEVGLGGRLDSTNVCQPALCVITNVSIDHVQQLGDTVDKIAWEKAGIIKSTAPVVSGATHDLAVPVVEDACRSHSAPLWLLDRDFEHSTMPSSGSEELLFRTSGELAHGFEYSVNSLRIPAPVRHQMDNAAIAIAAVKVLEQDGLISISADAFQRGLAEFSLIGRCERLSVSPLIVG